MKKSQPNIIGEFTIFPIGVGTSVGKYVNKAYIAMQQVKGIKLQPTAMSTIIEAPTLDKIWEVIQSAHKTLLDAKSKRIYFVLKIDDRRDKPHSSSHKVAKMVNEK